MISHIKLKTVIQILNEVSPYICIYMCVIYFQHIQLYILCNSEYTYFQVRPTFFMLNYNHTNHSTWKFTVKTCNHDYTLLCDRWCRVSHTVVSLSIVWTMNMLHSHQNLYERVYAVVMYWPLGIGCGVACKKWTPAPTDSGCLKIIDSDYTKNLKIDSDSTWNEKIGSASTLATTPLEIAVTPRLQLRNPARKAKFLNHQLKWLVAGWNSWWLHLSTSNLYWKNTNNRYLDGITWMLTRKHEQGQWGYKWNYSFTYILTALVHVF